MFVGSIRMHRMDDQMAQKMKICKSERQAEIWSICAIKEVESCCSPSMSTTATNTRRKTKDLNSLRTWAESSQKYKGVHREIKPRPPKDRLISKIVDGLDDFASLYTLGFRLRVGWVRLMADTVAKGQCRPCSQIEMDL